MKNEITKKQLKEDLEKLEKENSLLIGTICRVSIKKTILELELAEANKIIEIYKSKNIWQRIFNK